MERDRRTRRAVERGHHHPAPLIATLAVAVTLVVGLASLASAQPDHATAWFDRGVEALRAGRYAEAATAFREAHRLDGSVASLCNLAVTYDRWGDHEPEAAEAYRECANQDTTGRYRDYAERRARELRERAEALEDDGANANSAAGGQEEGIAQAGTGTAPGELAERPAEPTPASTDDDARGATPSPAAPESDGAGAGRPIEDAYDPLVGPMTWIGLATGVAAVGVFAGGAVLAASASKDAAVLDERYRGGDLPIPAGSNDEDRLEDARHKADVARVLYGVSGTLAAAMAALVIVDLATGNGADHDAPRVAISPQRGGALITAALELR